MDVKNNIEGINQQEKLIVDCINQIISEYNLLEKNKSSFGITNEVKKRISQIGNDNNLECYSSLQNGEILFDLIWIKKSELGFIKKVVLALESEISNRSLDGIRYDFEKLLFIKSEMKVMFCMAKGNYDFPKNVNSVIDLLEKCVREFEGNIEQSRYLLLIWEDYTNGFVFPHLIK